MKPILSYQNDPGIKRRFVRQIDAHKRADSIAQGFYGKMNGKFRGCAVGCSIHSLDRIDGRKAERTEGGYGDHALLAKRLGIPIQLAHLEDRIFERLPTLDAKEWPGRFARAIPVGRDLSKVWPGFALWLLTDEKFGVLRLARTDAARAAIQSVAALFHRELSGDTPSLDEWRAARSCAYAAYAAYAAAAYAAAVAYAAADAYADADAYAAYARNKWWQAAACKLLELMGAA